MAWSKQIGGKEWTHNWFDESLENCLIDHEFYHFTLGRKDQNSNDCLYSAQSPSHAFYSNAGAVSSSRITQWNSLSRIVTALHRRFTALWFQNNPLRGSFTSSYLTNILFGLQKLLFSCKVCRQRVPLSSCLSGTGGWKDDSFISCQKIFYRELKKSPILE